VAFTVEEIDAESILIESVLVMHRKYSKTLGFLTRQAFIEQAAKGFLLGAMDGDGTLAGYVLYYLPRREIKLTHLCVATGHRGQGIARMLIQALCTRHPERTGIRLNCRRDFPANDIWPRLDFSPLSDAPGRSQAGHLLTTWFRDFGHPTLFSQATSEVEPVVVAALDTDVFLDLDPDEGRPQSRESKGLLADWIADQAAFVVTNEVSHELNNHPDAATRRKQLFRCQAFRQAGESTEAWENSRSKLDSIRNDVVKGNHDRSDRDHVARAHAAGLQYFITRDEGLRNKLGESAHALGIRITSPGEFITDLWSSQDDTYAPAQLQNTDFGFESLAGVDLNALAPLFLMNGAVEKRKQLTKRIRDLASDATHVDSRVVKTGDGAPVALMVRVMNKDSLDVPVLRLSGTHQSTIGRHVAHLQSTFARDAGRWVTRVSDPHVSPHTARALAEEGFQEADGNWWSVSIPLLENKNKLAAILESIEGVPDGVGLKRAVSLLRKRVIPVTLILL
jgi:GNAT superfamily N-acetyltransferase